MKNCPFMLGHGCQENQCALWVEDVKIRPYHKEKLPDGTAMGGAEITDHRFKQGAGCAIAILALKEA